MITSEGLCVDAITLPTFGSQACSLISVYPCAGMQPAYQYWMDGCSLQRDCLSGCVWWRWQQDTRTAAGGGEEVGSCKQGGQKNCLTDTLRCNKSQSTTSLNSQAGRAACWEATRNKEFLFEQKSGSGSESKKQNGQRRWGPLYAGSCSGDQRASCVWAACGKFSRPSSAHIGEVHIAFDSFLFCFV